MTRLVLIMSLLLASDVVVIVGKRGSGKSTTAKNLIADQIKGGARVIAFDVHDEYSCEGKKKPGVELGPLTRHCTVDELLENQEAWLDDPELALSVVPGSEEDPKIIADDFAELVPLVRTTGGLTFVVDEVGLFEAEARGKIKVVATQSRHWQVPLILIAQRMALITKTARDQCSRIYTGVQTDPDDLRAIEKMVKPNLGAEGAEKFVHDVALLPRPGILEWREGETKNGKAAA